MKSVKTLEFWLVALLALVAVAAWVAGFDGIKWARHLIPVFAIAWMFLALTWMFREFIRWICD